MFQLRELRRERQAKVTEARKISDEANAKNKWTPALETQVKNLLDEVDALDDKIHQHQRLRDLVNDSLLSGANASDREALNALGAFARRGDTGGFQNAMTEDAGSGGIMVPYEQGAISRVAQKYNPIAQYCRLENIGTSPAKFSLPVLVTGASTEWLDETEDRNETVAPVIKAVEFADGEVSALCPISQWALEDTILGQLVTEELGRGFGRALSAAIVRGTGVKMPKGILSVPTATTGDDVRSFGTIKHIATGAGVSTVTADDLLKLVYDLAPEYRSAGAWVMTSSTLGAIRGLKDSTGRFLWEPSLTPGQPSTLLGFPICECADWDEIGTGKFPVLFGDLRRAYCVVSRSLNVIRDPFSQKPFVQIYGRHRVSGNVVDSCAVRLLKMTA